MALFANVRSLNKRQMLREFVNSIVSVFFSTTFSGGSQAPISSPWLSPVSTSASCNQTSGSKLEGNGSNAMALLLTPSFPADQQATMTLDSTDTVKIGVRGNSSTGAGYCALITSDGRALVLKSSAPGSETQVGGDITISSHSPGDLISLRATGISTVTLTVYVNGVSQGFVTDSSSPIASGQPFFQCNGFQTIIGFSATSV